MTEDKLNKGEKYLNQIILILCLNVNVRLNEYCFYI
jgi:hypothetical protein